MGRTGVVLSGPCSVVFFAPLLCLSYRSNCPLNPPILTLYRSQMTSLIEGWFEPVNGQPYVDYSLDNNASPRKDKSYLIIYDACAALGSLASKLFVDCELRLWPGNQVLEQKVIHIHGRFSIAAVPGDEDPSLKVEVHHFVIMHANDLANDPANDLNTDPTPLEVRTSVTLFGQVISTTDAASNGGADKFFTLEISEYIRDRMQTFRIRFVCFTLCCGMC